jgi:hypothetical protein
MHEILLDVKGNVLLQIRMPIQYCQHAASFKFTNFGQIEPERRLMRIIHRNLLRKRWGYPAYNPCGTSISSNVARKFEVISRHDFAN